MIKIFQYEETALTDEQPLKLILKGWMEEEVGVVAVVYEPQILTKREIVLKS